MQLIRRWILFCKKLKRRPLAKTDIQPIAVPIIDKKAAAVGRAMDVSRVPSYKPVVVGKSCAGFVGLGQHSKVKKEPALFVPFEPDHGLIPKDNHVWGLVVEVPAYNR